MARSRRANLHGSVFVVVLLVVVGAAIWFFGTHPFHRGGSTQAAHPAAAGGASVVH